MLLDRLESFSEVSLQETFFFRSRTHLTHLYSCLCNQSFSTDYFVYCEVGFTERVIGDHILSFTRQGNKALPAFCA